MGGWISSYAVLTEVTDSKGATVFAGIFWATKSIFMFVFAFAPGTGSQKLKFLIFCLICSGVISLLIVYSGNNELACYIGSFLFGIGSSSMYPLTLAFSVEEGLKIR